MAGEIADALSSLIRWAKAQKVKPPLELDRLERGLLDIRSHIVDAEFESTQEGRAQAHRAAEAEAIEICLGALDGLYRFEDAPQLVDAVISYLALARGFNVGVQVSRDYKWLSGTPRDRWYYETLDDREASRMRATDRGKLEQAVAEEIGKQVRDAFAERERSGEPSP